MTAGSSDLQGAFNSCLSFNITEINVIIVLRSKKVIPGIYKRWIDRQLIFYEIDHLLERSYTVYINLVHDSSFLCVLLRKNDSFKAFPARLYGNGQSTFDGL